MAANDVKTDQRWAPRVPQRLIARLYELDARGIYDDELLDEVGWSLLARCLSFIAAVNAAKGKATCPRCGELVPHNGQPDELLHCATCGWEETWSDYRATFQHQQLSGAEPVVAFFQEFVAQFPSAATARAKMLLIDRLIHGFHQDLLGAPTRTTGINLIQGRYHEVVDFLDRLSYGENSTPGTRETHAAWRHTINATALTWKDERLRRSGQ